MVFLCQREDGLEGGLNVNYKLDYLGLADEERLVGVLDLDVVVVPVVIHEGFLPPVVVEEGAGGTLAEVDVIDPVGLVVVSNKERRIKDETRERRDPELTWSGRWLPSNLS